MLEVRLFLALLQLVKLIWCYGIDVVSHIAYNTDNDIDNGIDDDGNAES